MKMASKTVKNYAPATLHSSDLSLGIHCICSQSRDTIPLSRENKAIKNQSAWPAGKIEVETGGGSTLLWFSLVGMSRPTM
jgi:hypothetical protein